MYLNDYKNIPIGDNAQVEPSQYQLTVECQSSHA